MKKQLGTLVLQTIENLPKPDYDESLSNSIRQDRINLRRKKVDQLRREGYTSKKISHITGYSLSSIEKDQHEINQLLKHWYDEESVKEFYLSLNDAIILCDNIIEELQVLYTECDNLDSKLRILKTISDFEERKIVLYMKTKSVREWMKRS